MIKKYIEKFKRLFSWSNFMTKKYILAGAIAAFLAAPHIVYAPAIKPEQFQPPKERTVLIRDALEKRAIENEEGLKKLLKRIDDLEHYRTDDFGEDSAELLIARLMMGEDEDSPDVCKIADAWTAITRAMKYNSRIKAEILRYRQYSCFNPETDSNVFLKNPLKHNAKDFFKDLQLARDLLNGKYKNPMLGATHYYNPERVKETPYWVKDMIFLGKLGDHLYYKEKEKN